MNEAKQTHNNEIYKEYPVKIPFQGSERDLFLAEAKRNQKAVRQLVRHLCLAWMSPETGPVIEAIMRGQVIPDLHAGQARELADTIQAGRE